MIRTLETPAVLLIAAMLVGGAPSGGRALAEERATDLSGQLLSNEQRHEYASRMELTPEQVELVQPILESAAKARRDALAFYGVNFEANQRPGLFELIKLKFAIDDINRKAEELLDPHLDDAQMRIYRTIVSEREAAMRARLLAMN